MLMNEKRNNKTSINDNIERTKQGTLLNYYLLIFYKIKIFIAHFNIYFLHNNINRLQATEIIFHISCERKRSYSHL